MQLAPLVVGLAALAAVLFTVGGLGGAAFFGALVGASVAVYGNLLVQYLGGLFQVWHSDAERQRRELGMVSAITIELADGIVAFEADRDLGHFREAPASTWDTLKLQIGEIYVPETVLGIANVYFRSALLNEKVREVAASNDHAYSEALKNELTTAIDDMKDQVSRIERRALHVGRD